MENAAIVTDSTSCINPELADRFGITVVPTASILLDGKVYIEYKNLTMKEAYRLIRENDFSTSAVTPGEVLAAFKELKQKTDNIMFLSVSNKLSAVFKSASTAAELLKDEFPEVNVRVIDTRNAAGGEGLIAVAAARAAAAGKSLDEIEKIVLEAMKVTRGIAIVDTLRYVYRSGRMSKISARLVSMLNIRPLNRITPEGDLVLEDKAYSRKSSIKKAVDYIKRNVGDVPHRFMVAHADDPELAEYFKGLIEKEFNVIDEVLLSHFSPIMGYATGPGASFVGFQPEIKTE